MDPKTGMFEPIPEKLSPEDPRRSWPRFRVGEVVEVKGGRFRVRSIGRRVMQLEGISGTHIQEN